MISYQAVWDKARSLGLVVSTSSSGRDRWVFRLLTKSGLIAAFVSARSSGAFVTFAQGCLTQDVRDDLTAFFENLSRRQ